MTSVTRLRKSPLSDTERALIAQVITKAGFPNTTGNVWTIHHDITVGVLWVHLHDGRQLPVDFSQFKAQLEAIRFKSRANNQHLVTA